MKDKLRRRWLPVPPGAESCLLTSSASDNSDRTDLISTGLFPSAAGNVFMLLKQIPKPLHPHAQHKYRRRWPSGLLIGVLIRVSLIDLNTNGSPGLSWKSSFYVSLLFSSVMLVLIFKGSAGQYTGSSHWATKISITSGCVQQYITTDLLLNVERMLSRFLWPHVSSLCIVQHFL